MALYFISSFVGVRHHTLITHEVPDELGLDDRDPVLVLLPEHRRIDRKGEKVEEGFLCISLNKRGKSVEMRQTP